MKLRPLQSHLERIYEVHVDHDVDDFLISDAALAAALDGRPDARPSPEKLLVRQDGECVDIALYVAADVLTRLSEDDPGTSLHEGNLEDYCTALEGVSHFLYLTWNASYSRPVSRLELEMQAEVDKFVASAFLMGRQRAGRIPGSLHERLFEHSRFDEHLAEEELALYRSASEYAAHYCAHLERTYLRGYGDGTLTRELRRFYRLTRSAKLRHARPH